jgi:hypothetical protein
MELDECVGFYVSDVWVGSQLVYVQGSESGGKSVDGSAQLLVRLPTQIFSF